MNLNEQEFRNGAEVDIGTRDVTPKGYGRLTIRKRDAGDHFDVYDIDNETVVAKADELEVLIRKANELSPLQIEYEPAA